MKKEGYKQKNVLSLLALQQMYEKGKAEEQKRILEIIKKRIIEWGGAFETYLDLEKAIKGDVK